MRGSFSNKAFATVLCCALVLSAATGCSDETSSAEQAARDGLHVVWVQTATNLRAVPLGYGTPGRKELLREGVPPFAPSPDSRPSVFGSSALALTTRLIRGKQSFTVDLFLLADGSAGGGDLMKQRSAYACVRVRVARGLYRTIPQPLPCRRDLLSVRDQQTSQRIRLQELHVSETG